MAKKKPKTNEPAVRARMTTKRHIWLSADEIVRACRFWVQTTYGATLPDKSAVEDARVDFDVDYNGDHGEDGGYLAGATIIIDDAETVLATERPTEPTTT
jgi:hypothetical protein